MSGRIETIMELKEWVKDRLSYLESIESKMGINAGIVRAQITELKIILEAIDEFEASVKRRIKYVEMFEGEETTVAELCRLLGGEELRKVLSGKEWQ